MQVGNEFKLAKNVEMKFRQLGLSGLTVSEVGLGCNNFGGRCDFERSKEVIFAALDEGITLFDTADIYGNVGGSETFMGEILKGNREKVVLASKFGMSMETGDIARGSRRYIRKALEASLARLQTDYLDLYQFHEPDPLTPIEETLAALDEVVREGKVRYIGSSNLQGWQIAEADLLARSHRWQRFISAQNNYSLVNRKIEAEVIPAAKHFGVGILPYYPLAAGLLSGKFKRDQPAVPNTRLASRPSVLMSANFELLEELELFAGNRGMGLLELAFAWLLSNPSVSSVIAGATSGEQLRANASTNRFSLNSTELDVIEDILARYAN